VRTARWIGLAGAVVFIVGMFLLSAVPGGGDVDAADFEEFYVEDDRTGLALPAMYALTLGALGMSWFFSGLRDVVGSSLGRFGAGAAIVGLALFVVGAGLIAGPSGVQAFGDEPFVGANVAHAFAQAGWAIALVGGALFVGVGIGALCLASRAVGGLTPWVAIAGLVVAVLQLGGVIWLPTLLLPLWVAVAALAGVAATGAPDRAEGAVSTRIG
jgi:hypothetical protein